ncbi:MAG: RdgB/HAM1 family non-canonical purine NTP pyrophosphatase [Flavobacteriales bacterium]
MKIYIASQNPDKIKEIAAVLDTRISLLSVYELGVIDELAETGTTLTANALQKARYIYQTFDVSCFADDSGLEVDSLNGEPGVHSARYAGEQKNPKENIQLLLQKLAQKENRKARFKTVLALILNKSEYVFEGEITGVITQEPRGGNGFGYDPIFIPDGYTNTFAEMEPEEKNKISHRSKAVEKLAAFLQKNKNLINSKSL